MVRKNINVLITMKRICVLEAKYNKDLPLLVATLKKEKNNYIKVQYIFLINSPIVLKVVSLTQPDFTLALAAVSSPVKEWSMLLFFGLFLLHFN